MAISGITSGVVGLGVGVGGSGGNWEGRDILGREEQEDMRQGGKFVIFFSLYKNCG